MTAGAAGPRIAYFVHDLTDPAVDRRVRMLRAGGAEVRLFGFRRREGAVAAVAEAAAVDLGRTRDARLAERVGAVAAALAGAPAWSRRLDGVQVILARNLEMLVLAEAARRLGAPGARLAYEVLDVHRVMLGEGAASRALRGLERTLMRRTSALVLSSPAHLAAYFEPRGLAAGRPVLMVENKVLALDAAAGGATPGPRPPGPPWRIGWFGNIRCRRSLDILADLARRAAGSVEVEIRGRPAYTEFEDFDAQVAAAPGVSFKGAYGPADLPGLYGGVHFTWAIDYFEAGQNSAWLLPNRLYEGQLHGAVAIALREVATGRWLAGRGAGLLLEDPARELGPALDGLSPAAYAALAERTAAVPRADLACDAAQCVALVQALASAA